MSSGLDMGALKEEMEKTRSILLADWESQQSRIDTAIAKSKSLGALSGIVMDGIDERRRLQSKFSTLSAEYRQRMRGMFNPQLTNN